MKHHWTYLTWTVMLFSAWKQSLLHFFPVISVKLLWNNLDLTWLSWYNQTQVDPSAAWVSYRVVRQARVTDSKHSIGNKKNHKHGTWWKTVHCANRWYAHEFCLDVESGVGSVLQPWERFKFRDTSSVMCLWIRGCFGLSTLDTLIKGGQLQGDQTWACVPCPIIRKIRTMQGRRRLLPWVKHKADRIPSASSWRVVTWVPKGVIGWGD